MTIIATEIQKWKRNKIVWCILALTLLFGAFAIERACSIARSSPYMDSFGDLYTLAFKNLSSLFRRLCWECSPQPCFLTNTRTTR